MFYEDFCKIPNHPRLLSEDKIVLCHEETARKIVELVAFVEE